MESNPEIAQAKNLLASANPAAWEEGVRLMCKALQDGVLDAAYDIGHYLGKAPLPADCADARNKAMRILARRNEGGDTRAHAILTAICKRRLGELESALAIRAGEKLLDYDGNPIEISRRGLWMPIKAELNKEGNTFCLHLKAKVHFSYADDMAHAKRFEQAVLAGFRQWRGSYLVFGGQRLRVDLELVRGRGGITVIPMTQSLAGSMQRITVPLTTGKKKEQIQSILQNSRSFASGGLHWSVRSKKLICIQSADGFQNLKEVQAAAKHEFGHALGLGDLYESRSDGLPGIAAGQYPMLDCYHTYNNNYHMVMCDQHSPISRLEMEMVLLAFADNSMQHFQPRNGKGSLSKALRR